MNKSHPILVAALAAALAAGRAEAQRPARGEPLPQLAQELFLAETAYAQERGEIQLTLHSRVEAGTHTRALAEYGVTDRLQLSLTTPVLERTAAGDDEDAYEAGVLYALLPSAEPVELSASVEASFARGAAPQWEAALVAARGWGRVQLHGTVAGELDGDEGTLWGALAALVDAGRATPTLELVRTSEPDDFVVPGLFVHPGGGVEIGAGVPVCLSCTRHTEGFRAMATVEF